MRRLPFRRAVGPYTPRNYDDTFEGTVSLVHAFADSRNIPAVKLAERVGIRKVIATAHQFGLASTIPPFLPVALGSVEATLQEQVAAYSSFPNDGVRLGPHLIRKVTNADGLTLSESPANVAESTSSKTARTMMTLLKAVIGPAAQPRTPRRFIIRLGARPAPPATSTTPGSSVSHPPSPAGYGLATTAVSRLATKRQRRHAALPLWIDFMNAAIADHPDEHFPGDSERAPATNLALTHVATPATLQ